MYFVLLNKSHNGLILSRIVEKTGFVSYQLPQQFSFDISRMPIEIKVNVGIIYK